VNQILVMLAWSWAQALVIASLAIVFSALAMRRSPAAGATIAWTGVMATLVLTVLAPAPVPKWDHLFRTARKALNREAASSSFLDAKAIGAMPPEGSTNGELREMTLKYEFLRRIVASIQPARSAVALPRASGRLVVGIVVLGVLLSLTRVGYGAWTISVLSRESRLVEEGQLGVELNTLSQKLGLRSVPAIRESRSIVSAAVIGCRRPAIVLPEQWRTWSAAELRAVLAHELAHIGRHDSLLRMVTALTVALQCCQPLVYWLRRQLMVAQEIAADELAAAAIGSRVEYLHAISKLALRQDGRSMAGPTAMLLPIFTGFLLRRIEMLRATDGSTRRVFRLTWQWSAIAILIAAAASTTAIRGLAQQPDAKTDGSARVARARDSKLKSDMIAIDAHAAAATLFQRPHVTLPLVTRPEANGFVVRLGEILRRPEIAEQARELDNWFADHWQDSFAGGAVPAWSLADIDSIAGDFRLIVKPLPEPTENGSNQVMFGANWITVRWQQPMVEQYESLLRLTERTDEASATKKSHGDVAFVELPMIPVMGPTRMCVCKLDDHMLLITTDEATMIARLDDTRVDVKPAASHKDWAAVEGGMFSFIASDQEIVHPLAEPIDEEAKVYRDFFNARQYAIGVDWQPGAKGIGVIKIQARFDEQKKAELFCIALRKVLDEYARTFAGELAPAKEKAAANSNPNLEFLRDVRISTRETGGSWQVDVQLAAPVDFPSLWKHL
jgi:beta-lactamase regulating signal transducer with metallopeptidase domain